MADPDRPQLYLVTPPAFDPEPFADRLSAVLDSAAVACIRLSLATRDEDAVARAADRLRMIAHGRDVALVVENHWVLVQRLGLDGVHLTDGAHSVRKIRRELGADAIVGAYCGASRHDGMSAGEAGADYVSFGPVSPTALGTATPAPRDLFEWWSDMIELPVVAEGGLTAERVADLAPVTDFFAIGEEIWREEDAKAAFAALIAPLS